eukprot:4402711-Ditylum_brightwellii.AAC.1
MCHWHTDSPRCARMRIAGDPEPASGWQHQQLQKLEHYIQTAFGDSSALYSRTPENPLKGLVQDYGPALADWALVSTPIINMTRELDLVYNTMILILSVLYRMAAVI